MANVQEWATLRAHQSAVRTVAFSSNGLFLVSGDESGVVAVWSLESRRPLFLWQAHDNAILTTEFWGSSGDLVVSHGRDNKLYIWKIGLESLAPVVKTIGLDSSSTFDSSKPQMIYSQDVNALNFCSIALSPHDFHALMIATPATIASELIDIYCLDDQFKVSRPFKALDASDSLPEDTQLNDDNGIQQRGQLGTVMALQLSENVLVAGYESGHVVTFDVFNGKVLNLMKPHKTPVLSLSSVEKSGETSWIYVSSADKNISRIDLLNGSSQPVAYLDHRGVATVCCCTPYIVTAGWDGQVRLFMKKGGDDVLEEVSAFSGGRSSGITAARMIQIDPGSKRRLRPLPWAWIAVAGKDGRVRLHGVSAG